MSPLTSLFHPTTTGVAGQALAPLGLAFDSSRSVPQRYDGEPSGVGAYGVFTGSTAGIMEWFSTPSGNYAAAASSALSIGAFGFEYSASLGGSGGSDAILALSAPTPATATNEGGARVPTYEEHVYLISFPGNALRPNDARTVGGPLPLPHGIQVSPPVVAASNGAARLAIAGEGSCCPERGSCGEAGEPAFESYLYSYTATATSAPAPSSTGIDQWEYVLDASGAQPACAIGVAIDNANSAQNLPGEVTFLLHEDGSVQPWLTHTSVWGERTSWKVAGAVSIAAYNQRVAILDNQGNVFSADPYEDAVPTLVYAGGSGGVCGGEVQAIAFDVTDPTPSAGDPGARGGSLILQMQDLSANDVPVVCSISSGSL